ncbi:TRAP transporter substrate-binding protein DctP [Seohaeicola nanhaiensis]|uniref:TRAP transporter substrate-binding protein DctP n=1 Tax=Seohaeicola nanhaiensis TaxID=1387282 RepID=A0ABV9KLG3_9RHOB
MQTGFVLRTVLAGALGVGFAAAAMAQDVTIRYSNWLPSGFWLKEEVIADWIKQVEEVTEGRVVVETTPKVVGSVQGQYDVIRDGLADLSWIVAGYTPGRFPMIEFGDLGLIGEKAGTLAPAMDRIYREDLAQYNVFEGVEPLSVLVISPLQMVLKGTVVNHVEDLKGLKLRSSSNTLTAAIEAVGAVPILKPIAEVYEMLASGTIDGQITNLNSVIGFGGLALTDSQYYIPGGMSNAVILWGLNKATWDKISPADQEAIRKISGEVFAKNVGEEYDRQDAAALEKMKEAGYSTTVASEEDMAKLREMLKPIETAWIERAKAAGLENAEEILAKYKKAATGGM